MEIIKRHLLIALVVLQSKSVLSEEMCSQSVDKPSNSAFGYELMEEKLDKMQFSFMELFIHVKELGETIRTNQLETNNLITVMEGRLTSTVSLITNYSKKILDHQMVCSNNDEIEYEYFKLQPNSTQSQYNLLENNPTSIKSCKEANSTTSGVFVLPGVNGGEPFNIWCELKQFDGGWLVFQHRFNGSVSFYRNWTEYKNGFGDIGGEFWLGLEKIHQLTKEGQWELAIEMKDFQDNYKYARYSEFALGSESEKYALKKLGIYSGTAGDYLSYHKGSKFSTYDSDNDGSSGNCAQTCQGAWWYNACYQSNLNGLHKNILKSTTIKWLSTEPSLKYTQMMIRKM